MSSFSKENKKHNRKATRAAREVGIVGVCKERIQEKICAVEAENAEARQNISRMERDIVRRADAGETKAVLDRMLADLENLRKTIAVNEGLLSAFVPVRDVLLDLKVELDAIMKFEWYGYIIRTVPEKKLPKMIRLESREDLLKVMALVEATVEKVEDRIAQVLGDTEQYRTVMKQIKETAAEMKRMHTNEAQQSSTESAVNALRRKLGQTADRPMPVDVETPAAAPAEKRNYANS